MRTDRGQTRRRPPDIQSNPWLVAFSEVETALANEALLGERLRYAEQAVADRTQAVRIATLTDVPVAGEAPDEILEYAPVRLAGIISDTLSPDFAQKYPAKAHGVKLARLAVGKSRQHEHLGALMMIHAMRRALRVANSAAITGLFADAKDEAAGRYCRDSGFLPRLDDPHKLYMPPASSSEHSMSHEPVLLPLDASGCQAARAK